MSERSRRTPRPTIATLAQAAGVSVATVDRVLNARLPVRTQTSRRVVEAAETIGYHATGLLRQRLAQAPERKFGFLLQKRHDVFYQMLGRALVQAAADLPGVRATANISFMDDLLPSRIAATLREASMGVEALAVVAVDHPHVNAAVEEIVAAGTPVFSLLSDLSTPACTSALSVDTRRCGRTAAWAMARMGARPGKVGVMLGSHRYLSQELADASFRSYMRENAPDIEVLAPLVNLDDDRLAREAVGDLVSRHRDLAGLYVAGGGTGGMIAALHDENMAGRLIVVCNELTPVTRPALLDGTLELVLGTPVAAMASQLVRLMEARLQNENVAPRVLFPAELHIRETL